MKAYIDDMAEMSGPGAESEEAAEDDTHSIISDLIDDSEATSIWR